MRGLGDLVVGIEDDHSRWHYGRPVVNNAVFRCAADSELLRLLLTTFEPGAIPAGMPIRRALEVRLRRLMGEKLPVQDMQFGATGPWPLNHYLRRLDLFKLAQPRTVFYPIGYDDAAKLLTPACRFPTSCGPKPSASTSGTAPLPTAARESSGRRLRAASSHGRWNGCA